MDNDIYKVYKYVFPSGKIYIGMTKRSVRRRFADKYKNKPMMEEIKECGWNNICVEILWEGNDINKAYEEEIRQIKLHNACNDEVGYNISLGGLKGMLGLKHTEEAKEKMRISGKGKNSGTNSWIYGKKHSEEMKEKFRQSAKNSKCVLQYTRSGEFVERYRSISEAARAMKTTTKNIRCCIQGVSHHACGYVWRLE